MCDQAMPYEFGTLVWFRAANRVWWPARIVDGSKTPEEFQLFMESRKNVLGVVYFEREKFYDLIINMNKVCLYSSPNKMEYVKKGHDLYLRQCAGRKTHFDMSKFMDDVLKFEKEIGGDMNIFDKIPVDQKVPQAVKDKIKELFPSSSYGAKSRKSSIKTPNSKIEKVTNTPRLSNTSLSTPKKAISKTVSPKNRKSIPSITEKFMCTIIKDCNFKTNNYNSLKRHFAEHNKNKGNDETSKATIISPDKKSASKKDTSNKASSTTSNKRKNLKIKRSDTKKIKLQDELLKDWSDDDEVEEANISATSSTAIEKTEKTIFDFDEDSNKTDENVSDPQRSKLCDTFHDRLTPEVVNLEICAAKNDQDDNGIVKQSLNIEPRINDHIDDKVEDNDHVDKINENVEDNDDHIERATLLLENTEDNLDKINHLEDSLNCIAKNANKSDTKDNNDINDIGEADKFLDKCDSDIDVYNDINKTENEVENALNSAKENVTDDTSLIPHDSNNLEVQQLNGNVDKLSIVDESGVYNSNVNTEQIQEEVDVKSTVDDNQYDCLMDRLPIPNWVKESSWETYPNNGLKEANSFSDELKLSTSHENMLFKFLKGAPQPIEQGMGSSGGLIGEMPESKTNTGIGG